MNDFKDPKSSDFGRSESDVDNLTTEQRLQFTIERRRFSNDEVKS